MTDSEIDAKLIEKNQDINIVSTEDRIMTDSAIDAKLLKDPEYYIKNLLHFCGVKSTYCENHNKCIIYLAKHFSNISSMGYIFQDEFGELFRDLKKCKDCKQNGDV